MLGHDSPVTRLSATAHQRSLALDQQRRRPQLLAAPNPFALDLRIVGKRGRARFASRQPQIDRVAEFVAGKTKSQAYRLLARGPLHGVLAATHGTRKSFRPGPQTGFEAAFACERADDAALRDVGKQAQGAINIRLAARVRTRDKVERFERRDEIAQRPVVVDCEAAQHVRARMLPQ